MSNALPRCRLSQTFCKLGLRYAPELNLLGIIPCVHTVPKSASGVMQFTTSAKRADKYGQYGPHISSVFKLLTLRPERMSKLGQETINLSGKKMPIVPLATGPPLQCLYEPDALIDHGLKLRPFPKDTKGVFYYHNAPDMPELCAGVRFRICDSIAKFEHGRDLLDTRGEVWGYTIVELVKHKLLERFLSFLRTEDLIDEELVNDIHKLDITGYVRRYQYSLSAPFYLNVAQYNSVITYITRAKLVRLSFPQRAFVERINEPITHPLTGSIKCRFELSDLPEHKKLGPTLVIRVLDVVKPIVVDPLYNWDTVPVPVPGTLLYRLSWGRKRIVRIPLKSQRMAEDLLELTKTAWA